MADKKISALTSATTPLAGTEVLPIVQSGATVKVAVSDLTAGRAVSATQLTSTVAIGTAPLVVTSTTNVANLNASSLNGATFAAPGAIGGGTAAAGSFTTLSASGLLSANANLKVVDGANDFGTIQLGTAATYKVTAGATYSGYRFEVPSGTQYDFQVNSTTRALINGTGLAVTGTLSASGNFTPTTAAKGINFTANTPAAGMTSQLLNWYEEGTWTPTQGGGLTVVGAFTSLGKYTRIGRQVTVQAKLSGATSIAATSGEICGGLPFTSNYATIEYSIGSATNAGHDISSICMTYANSIYGGVAISATAAIYLTVTYFI